MPEKNYPGLEERTAKVEGILEQMDKRLDRVEVAIVDLKNEFKSDMGKLETSLKSDISKVDNRIEKLETKADSQFKWLVGIIIATWITAILTIIFKG